LGVIIHLVDDTVGIGGVVECVFHCLEIVVVNKSSHADAKFIETIGREVGGAVAVLVLQVEVCGAVEAPGSVKSGAALAHAINSRAVTVRVEASRYA
jgi:hypothetical protein